MDHSGNLDGSDGGVLIWLVNQGPEIESDLKLTGFDFFFFLILIDWLGFFCLVGKGERE